MVQAFGFNVVVKVPTDTGAFVALLAASTSAWDAYGTLTWFEFWLLEWGL